MDKKEIWQLALKLMLEQLKNTCYSPLERDEYNILTENENACICAEIYKVSKQFKTRYGIEN